MIVAAGVWYWVIYQPDSVVTLPIVSQPLAEVSALRVYTDLTQKFSITVPTSSTTVPSDDLYTVDTAYVYTALGSSTEIAGVKFTIPGIFAAGTNLSKDSYLSVEHLAEGELCDAVTFIGIPDSSRVISEGASTYSFASSSQAAAGNRYEEYVYVLPGSKPCIAVRYFIHYSAIENYDSGTVTAFNRTKLFSNFDVIRNTLVVLP